MAMYKKSVTAEEAIAKIPDEAFVAVGGINYAGTPMELIDAVTERYKKEKHPKNIALTNSGGNLYINKLAWPGLDGLVGIYYSGFPALDMLNPGEGVVDSNKIPVFHFTQGIGTQFCRAQAQGVPYLTKAGLGTYVDPRVEGGCANEKAREFAKNHEVVKIMEVNGEEYLHIDLPPVNVALIRATSADVDGNLIDDEESIKTEMLPFAMAAHNNGGIVIAQVNKILEPGQINAADVKVPGMLVDYVVVCSDIEKWAPQNIGTKYNPGLTGKYRIDKAAIPFEQWRPKGPRYIAARRAVTELWPECIANAGIGMPEGVMFFAAMEGIQDMYYQTIELGAIGGYGGGADYFSAAFNARAYLSHYEMFDFINGKGLDITFLGAAEIGADGSVNVSKIGKRTNGSGGFVNISTNTKKIVFMATHTTHKKNKSDSGEEKKGPFKFVQEVNQICFNAKDALKRGQDVLYITERAVFKLTEDGLMLVEYDPHLNIEKDILEYMAFAPKISPDLKPMPEHCFTTTDLGLKEKWQKIVDSKTSC